MLVKQLKLHGLKVARRTITLMAPTKTFNLAGLATSSVIISNPGLMEKFKKQHEKVHLNSNLFGILASEAAYTYGEEWLRQVLDYIKGNSEVVKGFLENELPMVKVSPLEATYLMWLDFNSLGLTNGEIKRKCIEEAGLGFNDGRMFGPGGEGFQRMNIACPGLVLKEALHSLERAFGPGK